MALQTAIMVTEVVHDIDRYRRAFPDRRVSEAWNAIGLDKVDPSVAFLSGPIEGRLLDLAKAASADADISAKPGNCEAVQERLVALM